MDSEFRRGQNKNHIEDVKKAIKTAFGSARFADSYGPLCFSPHPKRSDLVLNISHVPKENKNEYHVDYLYRFKPEDKTKKVSLKFIRGDDGEQKKSVISAESIEELLQKIQTEIDFFEQSLISKMTENLHKMISEAVSDSMVDLKKRYGHEDLVAFAKHFPKDQLQSVGRKTRDFTDAVNQSSSEAEVFVGLLPSEASIKEQPMTPGYYVLESGEGIDLRVLGGPWDCPVAAAGFAVEYISGDDEGYLGITSTIDSGISQLMSTGEPSDIECNVPGDPLSGEEQEDELGDEKFHKASERLEEMIFAELTKAQKIFKEQIGSEEEAFPEMKANSPLNTSIVGDKSRPVGNMDQKNPAVDEVVLGAVINAIKLNPGRADEIKSKYFSELQLKADRMGAALDVMSLDQRITEEIGKP